MGTAPPILQEPERMGKLVGVTQTEAKPGQKHNSICIFHDCFCIGLSHSLSLFPVFVPALEEDLHMNTDKV